MCVIVSTGKRECIGVCLGRVSAIFSGVVFLCVSEYVQTEGNGTAKEMT